MPKWWQSIPSKSSQKASRHSNFPTERLSHGFQQRGASISELTKPVADSKATYLTKHVPWSTAKLKLSISFFQTGNLCINDEWALNNCFEKKILLYGEVSQNQMIGTIIFLFSHFFTGICNLDTKSIDIWTFFHFRQLQFLQPSEENNFQIQFNGGLMEQI